MLLVQKYLENHSFGQLAAEHGVYASFSKSGHKFSLNYDQIEAKESNPLAQECRGLILALEDGRPVFADMTSGKPNRDNMEPGKTVIVAYPMRRFFNHGQGCAAEVNWSDPNLAVMEKLDGTLCIVYFDKFTRQWSVATRSVPEADLPMDNGLFTFRTLFEKAVQDTLGWSFHDFTSVLDKNFTYCFELTTPYNRIVVTYQNCRITLLAARDMTTLEEINPSSIENFANLRIPVVKSYTYSTTEELLNWVSSLNPLEHEGVVVRDSQFNRIKMKNAAYVAYNKLNDRLGSSERNCMEFVLLEKDDDVASFLPPEINANMAQLKAGLQNAIAKYDSVFASAMLNLKTLGLEGNKKEFAISVTSKHKDMWHAPFFSMWDKKASSMKEFIQNNRKDGTWGDSFIDKVIEISKK